MQQNEREELLMSKTRYRAIQSFRNVVGDGINLVEGEELEVREKTDNGWWLVRGLNGEGWAPSSYIGVVSPTVDKSKVFRHQCFDDVRCIFVVVDVSRIFVFVVSETSAST